MSYLYVTCVGCGWVHFQVSKKYATAAVRKFNRHYYSWPKEIQAAYGNKPASIRLYKHCQLCNGSYKNFRPATSNEIPNGSTIGPIMARNE